MLCFARCCTVCCYNCCMVTPYLWRYQCPLVLLYLKVNCTTLSIEVLALLLPTCMITYSRR